MTESNKRLISPTMMNHLSWILGRAVRQNRFITLDNVISMMERGASCEELIEYISEMEEYDRRNEMSMFHSWDEDSEDENENSEDEDSE